MPSPLLPAAGLLPLNSVGPMEMRSIPPGEPLSQLHEAVPNCRLSGAAAPQHAAPPLLRCACSLARFFCTAGTFSTYPQGLVHLQYNLGCDKATIWVSFDAAQTGLIPYALEYAQQVCGGEPPCVNLHRACCGVHAAHSGLHACWAPSLAH